MGSSTVSPASGSLSDRIREFRRSFKSASTPAERRSLLMKACDDRLISEYMSVEEMEKILGDIAMFEVFPLDKATGKQSAILRFTAPPLVKPNIEDVAYDAEGRNWYMCFFFEGNRLTIYYLTNFH
jgi:hypothetical protein